jgi:hypothetical protein
LPSRSRLRRGHTGQRPMRRAPGVTPVGVDRSSRSRESVTRAAGAA